MTVPTDVLPETLPTEPFTLAQSWLAEALKRRDQPNPNSMVLATTSTDGQPSARVVLCKQIVVDAGYIVFFTNYLSRKGQELMGNPRAAAVIHWDHLHRQIRLEGFVQQLPEAESDAYFASRPWQSRIGAWASAQSQPVRSRADLHAALDETAKRFGTPDPESVAPFVGKDFDVPRPPHWGGFRLWGEAVELWMEGESRIHDRARWTRALNRRADGTLEHGAWSATRLQP